MTLKQNNIVVLTLL